MKNYRATIIACFTGFIVQAVINNFMPMLFVHFNSTYGIPFTSITLLISCNFLTQLAVDAASVLFVDRIGYRLSCVLAHLFSASGLLAMAVLPVTFSNLLLAVILYAIGGGLIEVLISPIMENCPTDNKEKAMSLLHSFYCWGHVGVVLITTAFFAVSGIGNWKYLAAIWSVIPLINMIAFTRVPIEPMTSVHEESSLKRLFSNRLFWLFIVMMITSGASEHAVSQWASTLAEKTLGISKTLGDLFGPMLFAVFMGISRVIFGNFGEKLDLDRYFLGSVILCTISYLLIAVVPSAAVNLLGCALSGMAVGIFWPGTISNAAILKNEGTALYAFLALAGDIGCSVGPAVVGFVSAGFDNDLHRGILAAVIFPLVLLVSFLIYLRNKKRAFPL
ncbi:MAG: MFS transporter [Erysipelotrichaceae bacterium]|nr:MFS transporter [Erysipelotrichaceae bacterium]